MMARDAVCGMEVEEVEPGFALRLEGRTYWFCSAACQAEFRRRPQEYTSGSVEDEPGERDV